MKLLGVKYSEDELRKEARQSTIALRTEIMKKIKSVFLDPCFEYYGETDPNICRELYKSGNYHLERDYREFGSDVADPGDIFCFFVRAKKEIIFFCFFEK